MRSLFGKLIPEALRRFAKADRGVTAVEFAFVFPPFILIMGAMLESGLMLFTEYVLQTATQKAAREIRTGQAQSENMSESAFKAKICQLAGKLVSCGKIAVYVRSEDTFPLLKSNLPSFLNIGVDASGNPTNPSYSCGGPSKATGIVATYDWKFSIPYFMYPLGNVNTGTNAIWESSWAGGDTRRLYGMAISRNEPFPGGWGSC